MLKNKNEPLPSLNTQWAQTDQILKINLQTQTKKINKNAIGIQYEKDC